MNIKESLVVAGYKGLLLAHWMPWFGGTKHRDVGYQSWKPWVVGQQLKAMQNEGVEGVIATWNGDTVDPQAHAATVEMCYQCEGRGMKFALLLNPPMVQYRADKTVTPNQEVMNRLLTTDAYYILHSTAYWKNYVLEFSLSTQGVDVAALQKSMSGIAFLSKHTGFTWPEKAGGTLTASANTLATQKKDYAGGTVKAAGIAQEFCDGNPANLNQSVWDATKPVTVIPSQAGDFWYQQLDQIPKDVEALAIVTWNDYEEGTQIEPSAAIRAGIRIG